MQPDYVPVLWNVIKCGTEYTYDIWNKFLIDIVVASDDQRAIVKLKQIQNTVGWNELNVPIDSRVPTGL